MNRPNFVLLVTELLHDPLDEGMNRFTYHLAEELSRRFALRAFTNTENPLASSWLEKSSFDKLLLTPTFIRQLRSIQPRHGIYIPAAALTDASMFRVWRLHQILPAAQWHVIGLQWRRRTIFGRIFAKASGALFYAPSQRMVHQMNAEGLPTFLLPAGVDAERFRPGTPEQKSAARAELGVPLDRFVVAHVGPLRRSRNPEWFLRIADEPATHVLLICSTTHPADPELFNALQHPNITIHNRYVSAIEKVYQAADAYVFPVIQPTGAMESPLSVLEAMASGIPVLATPFGALADVQSTALILTTSCEDLSEILKKLRSRPELGVAARQWAEQHTWAHVLRPLFENLSPKV